MSRAMVSAIVPTFRRPAELARSLGSVLKQTWRPLELVVIDDGSGDETPRVLEEFAATAKTAGVDYRWLSVQNGGPGKARNAGMAEATGEFFAFLDDDDEWLPAKIERQLQVLTQSEAGLCYTRYVHADDRERPKPPESALAEGWVFEALCLGQARPMLPTWLVRRSLADKIGGFAPEFNFEDTEFCLRASLEVPFVCVREPLLVVHTRPSSVSREEGLKGDLKRDALKLRLLAEFAVKHAAHARFSARALKELRARIYDEHIKHLLWLGRVADARAAWDLAVAECGKLEILRKLKGKLTKAKVLSWFGRKLRKPK